MEGYLQVYHHKKYSKYWCILDGQQLSYYERLDLHLQQAVGIKGTIQLKNCELVTMVHETRPHAIRIKPEGPKKNEYIDCEKAADQRTWFQCLVRASKLHEAVLGRNNEVLKYTNLLGIDRSVKLSQRVVSRAYRKICLKAHPDRGGDVSHFNEISSAYGKLMEIQADIEARERSDEIVYEAIIEKGPEGVGLGLLVVEDPVRQRVVVQKMNDNIILHGLSAEASGEILPADSLVGIDKDDCMMWPLVRVRTRLNAFRVPVGNRVRLRFQRRLSPPELDESMELPNNPNVSASATPIPNADVDEERPHTTEVQSPVADEVIDSGDNFVLQDTPVENAPPVETIAIDEYRKVFMELENTKKLLSDSQREAKSWKDQAASIQNDYEQMKSKQQELLDALRECQDAAERDTTEIQYLKTKLESVKATTPATATDVLQVSRLSSDVSLGDVLEVKKDKKLIAAQLQQLRYYCGDPPPHLADNAADNESIGSASKITVLDEFEQRLQRFREAEDIADQVLAAMEQLIEKYGADSSS